MRFLILSSMRFLLLSRVAGAPGFASFVVVRVTLRGGAFAGLERKDDSICWEQEQSDVIQMLIKFLLSNHHHQWPLTSPTSCLSPRRRPWYRRAPPVGLPLSLLSTSSSLTTKYTTILPRLRRMTMMISSAVLPPRTTPSPHLEHIPPPWVIILRRVPLRRSQFVH